MTDKNAILKKIEEYDTIIIHRHKDPDPDALGSQGGLQHAIKATFPQKSIYVVGEEIEGLIFLNRMSEIEDLLYDDALVIVCDTANEERISDKRYKNGKFLIKIDHHPNNDPYGDLEWVDVNYSSTSEMLVDFILSNDLKLNVESARLLFAGIVGDTGRFMYDNTKPRTLQLASKLLEFDFNPQDLYNQFYKMTKEVAVFQGYILQNFEVNEKGVASIYITKDLMKEFKVSRTEASNLVNTLADIEGNHIWVFFVESGEEIIVNIRSKNVVINKVANKFHGGGHPLAAGATLYKKEDATNLITELSNLL